jgi:hypothetical protein
MSPAGTTYDRATAGYDEAFEQRLVEEITLAIGRASICSDANIVALRTGETASALLTVLAATLALSPAAVRSPTALRRTTGELGKRLQRRVAAAVSSPDTRDFLHRRPFRSSRGGHA